jgi:deoxyribodipyrimidine photo-lyase
VEFIRESLVELDGRLRALAEHPGGPDRAARAADSLIPNLAQALGADAVFTHHDDEPAALARDARVRTQLAQQRQALHTYQDHTVFERSELLTRTGSPYTVFTPTKRPGWHASTMPGWPRPVEPHAARLAPRPAEHCRPVPTLQDLGFEPSDLDLRALPAGSRARSGCCGLCRPHRPL